MIWSPLSNLLLYGQTADIAAAVKSGLRIALGPDWSPSGSKNLLGELKIARLAADLAKAPLSDFDLLSLATKTPAEILRWDAKIGTIEPGKRADLLVVDGQDGNAHSHLLTRTEHDVALVVINGVPRYGTSQLMRQLLAEQAQHAEAITIAGRARLLDLRQATEDPVTGALTLATATSLLSDGLSHLPELAHDLLERPALDLLEHRPDGQPPVFLVLDHDDLANEDLRPHLPDAHGDFTAEPATDTVSARATPLGDLLEPLTLDPLTVVDDARFLELLGKERNLPTEIASAIPGLY